MSTVRAAAETTARHVKQLAATLYEQFDLREVFMVAGLSAIGYGLAQVYPPLAWIVCGSALFWLGVR